MNNKHISNFIFSIFSVMQHSCISKIYWPYYIPRSMNIPSSKWINVFKIKSIYLPWRATGHLLRRCRARRAARRTLPSQVQPFGQHQQSKNWSLRESSPPKTFSQNPNPSGGARWISAAHAITLLEKISALDICKNIITYIWHIMS